MNHYEQINSQQKYRHCTVHRSVISYYLLDRLVVKSQISLIHFIFLTVLALGSVAYLPTIR